jgi:hypothetical protein
MLYFFAVSSDVRMLDCGRWYKDDGPRGKFDDKMYNNFTPNSYLSVALKTYRLG